MKYFKIFFLSLILLGGMGCTGLEESGSYLNISLSSFTFNGSDNKDLVIEVECSGDWIAETEDEWIQLSDVKKNSVTVQVKDNEEKNTRNGEVNFIYPEGNQTMTLSISQFSKMFKGRMEHMMFLFGTQISDNGRWIFGTTTEQVGAETWHYKIYRIDTKTGETQLWGDSYTYNEVKAVSDDGNKIIICNSTAVKYAVFENGKDVGFSVPDKYGYFGIEDMTPDGKIMVGYVFEFGKGNHKAVKWENGVMTELERPEKNSWGGKLYNGLMARGISNDGRIIYGSEWDGFGLIYWKDGKINYLGEQLADTEGCDLENVSTLKQYASNSNLSSNGKYIAATYEKVSGETGTPHPAIVNTQTGNVEIYDSMQAMGRSISNDGILFCEYGDVVQNGNMIRISDYFQNTYGLYMNGTYTVSNVSPDNNVYYGLYPVSAGFGVIFKGWYFVVDASLL